MKKSFALLFYVVACPAFAGSMGDVSSSPANSTYVAIAGGYYGGNYQSNFTGYDSGVLTEQQSFNDTNQNGYGQLGLGASAQIGSLMFDHQVSISKLGGSVDFNTRTSHWSDTQNVDFGYDLMPKINLLQKLDAFGILGVHYARFTYKKIPFVASAGPTTFNNYYDQIGFNLGAGLSYRINPAFAVGVKFQHWQYNTIQVNGLNPAGTSIDIQQITPGFNLVGVELRYYIN